MKKNLGISLIFVSILFLTLLKLDIFVKKNEHNKIIERVFIKGEKLETDYIGYIQIDSVDIKRGIVEGINDEILNNNDVGMIRDSNIILAGHAIEDVFGKLHNISLFAEVKVHLYDKDYYFMIYKKIIVEKGNLDYLNSDLVLITCTNDGQRLLVLGSIIYK